MAFSRQSLRIDAAAEVERISLALMKAVRKNLRRRGAVVGVSGGIDSSVVLALAARSLGGGQVRAIIMPERDSDPESEVLARLIATQCGVDFVVEDITRVLDAFGGYRRRDDAVGRVFPEYHHQSGYRAKITLPANLLNDDTLNIYSLVVETPDGRILKKTLSAPEFRQIVAACNLKQRTRMSMLYYWAELNNFAVVGTANKNEHDLGFFVKYGDGGVDVNPIAHLYKTQVYQLAEFLGIPEGIRRRAPTTDTYPARSTQEEFFFRLPFDQLDLLMHGMETCTPIPAVAEALDLSAVQVGRVYKDLVRKHSAAEYLKAAPLEFADGTAPNEHKPSNGKYQ
jgi:NAD+ synthase